MKNGKILWVDDEIESFKSHIIFLSERGYEVSTATNGDDALDLLKESEADLVFLDENMPGMGGLELLSEIKSLYPNLPAVMITKNEEESIMVEAIGSKISDYLTKPVNPSQVLLVCKKLLDGKKIQSQYAAKDYLQDFRDISISLQSPLDYKDWIDIYIKLVGWDIELDAHPETGLEQTLNEQKRECNQAFSKFVEKNYKNWVNAVNPSNTPVLTPDILNKYVAPELLKDGQTVFFIVIDCLRLDQWMLMEQHLQSIFKIEKEYYYSIFPTATAYSRNSLFAGAYPSDIEKYYPDLWYANDDDERTMNKYEKEMLQKYLDKKRIKLKNELKYIKVIDPEYGKGVEQNIHSYQNSHLTALVINFLDMIAHGRSDSDLLKEIAPDEAAYRSLTNSWFTHSSLLGTLRSIARMPNAKVIITTDHGSIRSMRGAKVLADKETSTNLRFKFGRNMKVDEKHALFIKEPGEYKLPKRKITTNYIIAKEDYYFVYPTDYHKYLSYYKDTFQHGGISMEEMILPVITMEPK